VDAAVTTAEFAGTDRFAVLRSLGAGGMGAVYEVFDKERDERVALKTLRRLDGGLLYRLKTEFRALQNLHHPNLIRLGELIEAHGQWFFTMELVDGDDFLSWVRALPMHSDAVATVIDLPRVRRALEQAATIDGAPLVGPEALAATPDLSLGACDPARLRHGLIGVSRGLCALHDRGLVHRDVKPSNILVTEERRVVLLDFGLVRGAGFGERTSTGSSNDGDVQIVGTPAYMAPEQATASWAEPASDWYAVGVMMYQALTGRLPFIGSPMQVLVAKQQGLPPAPSTIEPEVPAELEALCLDLLRPEPSERPTGAQVLARLGAAPEPMALRRVDPDTLVGRERELGILDAAMAAADGARPVVVYVSGRSGMGKSALVERFLGGLRKRADVVVLHGRCYERESVPYKALDSLIDDLALYLSQLDPLELEEVLPPRVGALAQLFPTLQQVPAISAMPVDRGRDPALLRRRAVACLRELLARIAARTRLVLSIDDLQWSDRDSAGVLADLLGPPSPPPLLLLGSFRSDHEPGPIALALERHAPGVGSPGSLDIQHLVMAPLSPVAAQALAGVLLGDLPGAENLARAIAAESDGSPFYIGELVRYLRTAAPDGETPPASPSLDDVIAFRIGQLAAAPRRLLQVIALVGRPVAQGLATRAAGITSDEALTHLRAASLVRTHGARERDLVETFHDRIRVAVLAGIDAAGEAELSQRLATALIETEWADPDMLGVDFLAAVDRNRARAAAIAAAERAAEALAFDRAATLYQLALDVTDDPAEQRRLHRSRAAALDYAGRGAEAADDYLAVSATADGDEKLELDRLAADALLRAGHIERGTALLAGVLGRLRAPVPSRRGGALAQLAWRRVRLALRGLDYVARSSDEVPPRDLARVDALFAGASTLAMIDNLRGASAQAEHLLRALSLGEERRVCRALVTEVAYLSVQGGRASRRADELARRVVDLAEKVADPYLMSGARIGVGTVAFFQGRYRVALDAFREAERGLAEDVVGAWWERNTSRFFLCLAQINSGDFLGLARTVEEAVAEAARRKDFFARSLFAGHPTVWLALRDDRLDGAHATVEASLEGWPDDAYYQAHHVAMTSRIMLHLYEGDGAGARALLQESLPLVKALMLHRLPFVMGEVHKLTGQAAVRVGDAAGAMAASRSMDRIGVPVGQAFAASLRAAVAVGAGDRDSARRELEAAIELFAAAGSEHDVAAARWRLGELVGGSRGDRLISDARSWMEGQGVAAPERMIEFLAPPWLGHSTTATTPIGVRRARTGDAV
jgi:serine/threonine protein kinase/tetratricopeptide (TPR) repeat protein